jgi:endonuclease I/beta-lactamase superfamily II metal-dependent hydrolase
MRNICTTILIVLSLGVLAFATGNLDVYFIDVEHGDAILVKYEETEWLIDSGYKNAWSASSDCSDMLGLEVDLPLEYFILSHAHQDHYSALDLFLSPCQIQTLSSSFDCRAKKILTSDANEASICRTKSGQIPSIVPVSSDTPVPFGKDGVTWKILHPSTEFARGTASTNNKSLVLLLTYGNVSFLFTGDLEDLRTDYATAWSVPPGVLILKAPHHGRTNSATVPLAASFHPDLTVISTDDCIPETSSELLSHTCPFMATSTSGTVHLRTDGHEVWVTTDTLQATSADRIVSEENETLVRYSEFLGLHPSETWNVLDSASYWAIPLAPPIGYYDSIDLSSSDSLRHSLHDLIDCHFMYDYTTSQTPGDAGFEVDTWDIISLADSHPQLPQSVIDLYLNETFERQYTGTSLDPHYNREHSWPKSLGFSSETSPAYTDCHHLFAAYSRYNSSRGNNAYGACESGTPKPTLENLGRGGNDTPNMRCKDTWETWNGRRGDVARAMFYMAIRYEGDVPREPNLELTDELSLITKSSAWRSQSVAYMGQLSVLLEWHKQDPVDDQERRRNTIIYLFQGNRNPFVDHPEWVEVIFR